MSAVLQSLQESDEQVKDSAGHLLFLDCAADITEVAASDNHPSSCVEHCHKQEDIQGRLVCAGWGITIGHGAETGDFRQPALKSL